MQLLRLSRRPFGVCKASKLLRGEKGDADGFGASRGGLGAARRRAGASDRGPKQDRDVVFVRGAQRSALLLEESGSKSALR